METAHPPERRSIILMLISVALFAVNILMLRAISLATPQVDGYVSSVFRGIVGWIVVVVCYRGRGFEPGHLISRPLVLVRGIVGAAGILVFYVTIVHLGAGRAVILNLTYPIFGAVLAVFWLKESLSARQLTWMLLALGGLGIFFAGSAFDGGITRFELLAILGAVVAGVAVVLIRILRHTEHASTIYASQCIWSFVVALPLCHGNLLQLPLSAIAGLVVASVLVSGGQLAMTESFRSLSVAKGSSIQMLLPVATALGGIAFFGERYVGTELLGAAVTLGATWQVVRARSRQPVTRDAIPFADDHRLIASSRR